MRAVEVREQIEGVQNLPIRGDMRVIGVVEDVITAGCSKGTTTLACMCHRRERKDLLALVRGDEDAALHAPPAMDAERYPAFDAETLPLSAALRMQIYPFRAAAWLGWILGCWRWR